MSGGPVPFGGIHYTQNLNRVVRKSSWRLSSGSGGHHPNVVPRADSSSVEDEFFCLTPDDARSIASSGRSRNASSTSISSAKTLPVQMGGFPDTKIFSVAVESRPSDHASDVMVISDVDTDYTGRFAVVSQAANAKKFEPQQQQQHQHPHPNYDAKITVQKIAEKQERPEQVKVVESVFAESQVKRDETAKAIGKSKKGKKNKKGKSSEESGSESSSVSNVVVFSVDDKADVGSRKAERDFDLVTLKADNFCREITPKVEDEEVFELTSNNAAIDTTEDLLADALLSVVDDDVIHSAMSAVKDNFRVISPTPSDEFTDMKVYQQHVHVQVEEIKETEEEEEEKFFVRETKSGSPETEDDEEEADRPLPVNLVASPKMVSCFEEMFGPVNETSIVKSIEFAKKLYGDDDDDDADDGNDKDEKKMTRRSIRAAKNESANVDSSEDDLEFKPVSRRQKRTKKKDDDGDEETTYGSLADSESSVVDDPPMTSSKPEGWSFEADDIDISKLIAEVAATQQQQQQQQQNILVTSLIMTTASHENVENVEEKTSLDEIFKFDSEIVSQRRHNNSHHHLQVDDINNDDDEEDDKSSNFGGGGTTTDDSENDCQEVPSKVMSTSLNVAFEETEASEGCHLRGATSLTQSLVCGSTTSADSSSVGESPNPKKNKNKSKRKKRR